MTRCNYCLISVRIFYSCFCFISVLLDFVLPLLIFTHFEPRYVYGCCWQMFLWNVHRNACTMHSRSIFLHEIQTFAGLMFRRFWEEYETSVFWDFVFIYMFLMSAVHTDIFLYMIYHMILIWFMPWHHSHESPFQRIGNTFLLKI